MLLQHESAGSAKNRRGDASSGLPKIICPTNGAHAGEGVNRNQAIAWVNSGLGFDDKGAQRADSQA